jgi:hypothetical protein
MVFTTETGGFCGRGRILRHLHGLLIKNDLPDCTVHSLRHTFASILINEGVHIKAVSAILGHSSVRVTSDIYAHAFADYEAKAAEAISLALGIIAGEKPERGAQTEGETRGIGAEGGQKGDKKGRRKSATKLRQNALLCPSGSPSRGAERCSARRLFAPDLPSQCYSQITKRRIPLTFSLG